MSRTYFTASCPLSLFYFHQNQFKTKHTHDSLKCPCPYLRLVPVAIAVTMVRIGKRVHAQRSYLFPELLKQRPLTPLCRTHTDLKSVSMPCLCLCICAVVYDPNRGVSFLGFGLAGRLVPPIGSYGALTLEMSLERDQI